MEFSEFQSQARATDRAGAKGHADDIVPILGLAGEVGELVNEFKKFLRDGQAHTRFSDRVREELGDVLWYVATVATRFGLDLNDVARANIEKTQARWGMAKGNPSVGARRFDDAFLASERFPRQFRARFTERMYDGKMRAIVTVNDRQMGQELTDNAYEPDGYRFHDVFHLACVAVLGWSPVTRRNLGLKRRSNLQVDEVEDGGRAIVTEEGISALVFAYAADHNALDGISTVDYSLLKAIRIMTAKFEVGVCTTGEWEAAILTAYRVWKEIAESRGGDVALDLDRRTMEIVRLTDV